jgi:hypothetical protein
LRAHVASRAFARALAALSAAPIAIAWPGAGGRSGRLGPLARLFPERSLLPAGRMHRLALALLIGASLAAGAARRGLPRGLPAPALALRLPVRACRPTRTRPRRRGAGRHP